MKKSLSLLLVFSHVFLLSTAHAAVKTWDGGGVNDNWQTAANWDLDAAPVATDDLEYAGVTRLTPTNDFAAATTFNSLTFSAGADPFTLSGNSITLAGNVTNNDDSLQTINNAMIMAATRTFNTASTGSLAVGGVLSGAGGVTKTGAQTLTLSGINTYTGVTTISAGTLSISAASGIGDSSATNTISLGGGTLLSSANTYSLGTTRTIIQTAASTIQADAGTLTVNGTVGNGGFLFTLAGAGNTTVSGIISGAGGLTKSGAGTSTLSAANTYTGATTVSAGVLNVQNATGLGTVAGGVSVTAGAALQLQGGITVGAEALTLNGTGVTADGALRNISGTNSYAGAITLGSASRINTDAGTTTLSGALGNAGFLLTAGGAGNTTVSGIISGAGGLTKDGAGTLTLSGVNTYTGATTISAGTVALGADSTSGAFALNGGTLTLGTNDYNVTGTAAIAAGTTVNTTTESVTSFGRVISTGVATVSATTNVNVTVNHAVANNQNITLVDGTGGAGVSTLTTVITDNSRAIRFTQGSSTSDLVLVAVRESSAAVAPDSNTRSVVAALNSINPLPADLSSVLSVVDTLATDEAVAAAYDEMLPDLSAGSTQASFAAAALSASVTQSHLGDVAPASSVSGATKPNGKGKASTRSDSRTGVSTGDPMRDEAIWIKGFGSYGDHDRRDNVNGYEAVVGGVAGGYDLLQNDLWTIGVGGGYAYSDIDTKGEDNNANVDSYQGMIYAGYADGSPWFFNGVFSFAWNEYDATRGISFGSINRVAEANYDGQQYTGNLRAGYTFESTKEMPFDVTPLASFQYSHLNLDSYTETGAGDLSLRVADQDYDQAQTGLGVKVSKAYQDQRWGTFVPELHAKWLYDFIGDEVATTNTFTAGGASFSTRGFEPAQHSINAGAGLAWYTKGNMTVDLLYDFELKEDYYSHSGSVTLRWLF